MLRKLITFLTIYLCFILQCSVFNHISLGGIVPNILIIITASFGFIVLIYTIIGYLNGFFKNIFYPEDIKLPMILITVSELVYCILYYIFKFLLRGRLNIGYYFVHIMLPEIVYTIIITLPLYLIIVWINEHLEAYERRNS